MSQIERLARRDAAADFADTRKPSAWWAEYVSHVRDGISVGPAAEVMADCGREALCNAWGVDPGMWDLASAQWFRSYNLAYCLAIDALCSPSSGR